MIHTLDPFQDLVCYNLAQLTVYDQELLDFRHIKVKR